VHLAFAWPSYTTTAVTAIVTAAAAAAVVKFMTGRDVSRIPRSTASAQRILLVQRLFFFQSASQAALRLFTVVDVVNSCRRSLKSSLPMGASDVLKAVYAPVTLKVKK